MADHRGIPGPLLRAGRLLGVRLRHRRGPSPSTRPTSAGETGFPEPSLTEVPIVDLFVILVDGHGFEVKEAVRRLTLGMLAAGYEADTEHVAAADAMDIVGLILRKEHRGRG